MRCDDDDEMRRGAWIGLPALSGTGLCGYVICGGQAGAVWGWPLPAAGLKGALLQMYSVLMARTRGTESGQCKRPRQRQCGLHILQLSGVLLSLSLFFESTAFVYCSLF